MTLELKPLGNSCNLGCTYCYENSMRDCGNSRTSNKYNLDLMLDIADNYIKHNNNQRDCYTVFGGEALLVPIKDLEEIFKRSYEKYGFSSVQTNGTLISDKHIELFKKYSVSVGISTDGPNELNSLRIPLGNQDINVTTKATNDNIRKLIAAGIPTSVIITLHKQNASEDKLGRLINFIDWLITIGANNGIIHMLEVDSIEAKKYELTEEENTKAMLKLAEFFENRKEACFSPFSDIKKMIFDGDFQVGCVWRSCDPMNSQSVYGIEGDGQLSNCGMVNKEGIEWTKNESEFTYERDYNLYNTEQKYGGCKGCKYFIACNGYCPGSSIDGDWRNRSYHCETIKNVMSFYENIAVENNLTPFSIRADRSVLEKNYFKLLEENKGFGKLSDLEEVIVKTIEITSEV